MRFWLMKSEPEVFSIDDLKRAKRTWWEGVRNYQARNFMTADMSVGDPVLFYHSNASPSGIAGLARVSAAAKADPTALDSSSEYFDKKATKENPIWKCVQVEFLEKFPEVLSLEQLRREPALTEMLVLKKGQRLSVQPVDKRHYDTVCAMGRGK